MRKGFLGSAFRVFAGPLRRGFTFLFSVAALVGSTSAALGQYPYPYGPMPVQYGPMPYAPMPYAPMPAQYMQPYGPIPMPPRPMYYQPAPMMPPPAPMWQAPPAKNTKMFVFGPLMDEATVVAPPKPLAYKNPMAAPANTDAAPSSAVAKYGNPQPSPPSGVLEDRSAWGANSGRPLRFWASAEYLLWWTKGGSVPPLVTTGPALPVTPSPGSFAAPGTVVLFGGDEGNRNPFSGGRFTLGFWFNDCQTIGAEANFFFLGQPSNDFNAFTSGAPGSIVLARPFFDTSTGTFNSELVGFPGLAAGNINVHSTSGLLGAGGNLLFNLCRSCDTCCDSCCGPIRGYRVDLLAGLSYMQLGEGIGIAENTQVVPTSPVFAGANISGFDQFDTVNRFYGAQLGIRSQWWWNRVFVNAIGTVALGDTHQTVDINGATRITTPGGGASTVLPGSLLAQPSNIGHYSRDQFSVVPQLGLNAGYQLTRNLSVFAGYTIIYWTNVQRPEDAISTQVNSTRVPTSTVAPSGPLDPQFNFHNSNFLIQGINFGIQLRF